MDFDGDMVGLVKDSIARGNFEEIYSILSEYVPSAYPYRWVDRDDTNLLDPSGDYTGQSISTGVTIRRALLRAVHNSDNITFALEVLA